MSLSLSLKHRILSYSVLGLMMDRLYAIKRPLQYSDVVKKDQLLRSASICVTKYDESVLGYSDEIFFFC